MKTLAKKPAPLGRGLLVSALVVPLFTACGGGGIDALTTTTPTATAPATTTPPAEEPLAQLLSVNLPFALSDFDSGDKPKIQRAGDGTLVVVYGDAPDNNRLVYDVKAAKERPARDIFVKTCKPDTTKTCDKIEDWSAATNISQSSDKSSITTDWTGTSSPAAYPGDIDKPNMKANGPVMVVTWVSKYCPDGDLSTADVQAPVQRAIKYTERGNRVIPFNCVWVARSSNNGVTWAAPIQLNTGERDAMQDANSGGFNTDTRKGQVNISWQEDPQGLLLGEAEGPGDGASGSNTNGGSDIWYVSGTMDLSVASTPADDFVLQPAVRLTDNKTGTFASGATTLPVLDGTGAAVAAEQIETGSVGASRANIGIVGTTALVAYEEKKSNVDGDGKYVRYVSFPFNNPGSADPKGCIISDPQRNARRVRFLTQSATDAGTGGVQLAIFWREGDGGQGAPADIVLRRAVNGLAPTNMAPAVDPGCSTSVKSEADLLASPRAENISSRAKVVTAVDNGLGDDTQANAVENAIAHRGVLRGSDLWVGYTYTEDLAKLATQEANYNFFIRKFDVAAGTWDLPRNVTNITDLRINVREPRIFGTPKSSPTACPSGNPSDPTTTDATLCQDTNIVYLAWGTQENVAGGSDLGLFISGSKDGGATFSSPIRFSTAAGTLFDDDEAAFETQVVTRPDGLRFWGVWTQRTVATGRTVVEFASGQMAP